MVKGTPVALDRGYQIDCSWGLEYYRAQGVTCLAGSREGACAAQSTDHSLVGCMPCAAQHGEAGMLCCIQHDTLSPQLWCVRVTTAMWCKLQDTAVCAYGNGLAGAVELHYGSSPCQEMGQRVASAQSHADVGPRGGGAVGGHSPWGQGLAIKIAAARGRLLMSSGAVHLVARGRAGC